MHKKKEIICELEFCVYQENGKCLLSEIKIGNDGCCESCIYLKVKNMQKLKQKTREEMIEKYKSYY